MLGVPWRQQLFMAVLLAGVCGLVLVYRGWIKDGAHVSVSSTTAIANELPVSSQVADLMAHDELLSPEAAREWLDWLLRQQQI